jgi:DNA-binding PadR family transcriptional regulator
MERGALRFILLDALRDGPRHGYDIMKSLEERTDGRYVPSPGTVYPTLQYLEDLGHVRATQKADRRVYEITDSGRAELEGQADRVAAFWSRFGTSPASESLQHEIRFLEEEMENLSRTVFNGLRDVIAREDRETVRTVRSVVERCREEIRGVITDSLSKKESQ